jgi:ectoine hydroxylase-related dioxygenase (phytanoyl-CoA dioxygenase family)
MMFAGTTWHAGQANRSDAPRAAILAAYTCKCIRPLEDMLRVISPETLNSCSDRLKRLLGVDFYCPAVMPEETP